MNVSKIKEWAAAAFTIAAVVAGAALCCLTVTFIMWALAAAGLRM